MSIIIDIKTWQTQITRRYIPAGSNLQEWSG